MKLQWQKFEIKNSESFKISKRETVSGYKKPGSTELKKMLDDDIKEISALQYKLYAENSQSLLIVLQGMDSSGKDSVIRHIMSGLNPQGVLVHSFKHPSGTELEHSYLWRHAVKLPEKGKIAI